ncbi:MAG TPA: DNA polymerase I [Bacteroidales bacterium]|nr:DNA polymerase I [Bacteroidales bacterium]
MAEEKRLFLLDAYALIYRSYYAFLRTPMFNAGGLNTSCIFGFVNTLEELLSKEKPSHVAVAFDPAGPNFRHEMYPEYKANREEMPEDIKKSIPYIKEILKAYCIPIIQIDGFEADDVIGTLAKKGERDGYKVYMMTPDKDYIQLLSDNIFIYKPSRSGSGIELVDKNKACTDFKLKDPVQFIDILALMGDSSDNIPGAPGVGEKTAMKLIEEYQTVENVISCASSLKGKLQDIIINNAEQILLSKQLATIATTISLSVNEEELVMCAPDMEAIRVLFESLNFKTLEKRVMSRLGGFVTQASAPKPAPVAQQSLLFDLPPATEAPAKPEVTFKTIRDVPHNYILVDTPQEIDDLVQKLSLVSEFCFDTETTGLNVIQSQLVGMSFAWESGVAYYVPVPADHAQACTLVSRFKLIFESEGIGKIGQNIKFDILILKNYSIEVKGEVFDTMLAHYILQPEQRHNMNYLSETYLGYTPVHIEELIGEKGRGQLNMRSVSIEKIKEYAAEDADITYQLKERLEPELTGFNLDSLARTLEMPLIYTLAEMEYTGVNINTKALTDYAVVLREQILAIESKIYTLAGVQFNISSPKQMGDILFERLKIDENVKLTKTKQYSTSEETLTQLISKHEIIPLILEYRGLMKLLNTYVEALPRMINPRTGRIHTSYNQAIAATGRLSSVDPNLQNIPIRDENGRELRKAFVPTSDEFVLLSADYSQIELRIMAHFSKDANMIEAFIQNADIHTSTAAKIYGILPEEVTREMRSKAKTANFGIIYGISAFGLSQRLNIPRKEAAELIEGYFKNFPSVKAYMDASIAVARGKGYVETIMGRRRYLPDIHSRNATVRGMAERNAINSPIQGSAADIIKLAMINIHNAIKERGLRSRMILQVHDELVFDVYKPETEEVKNLVIKEMQEAVNLDVPLLVEAGIGNNWLESHG